MSNKAIEIDNIGKVYYIAKNQDTNAQSNAYMRLLSDPVKKFYSVLKGRSAFADQIEFWALRNISFDLEWGEVVGVIGANGAGKTTLLRILSRITAPSEGQARVYGSLGSLLEVGSSFSIDLTGRENIYVTGSIYGLRRRDIKAKLDEIVSFAEIEDFIDTPVKKYSSGMYSRLAFAVSTHFTTDILVVDEVLATGDNLFAQKCLAKMHEETFKGRSILFVSHSESTVREICSRCIYIEKGKVRYAGSVEEAYNLYNNRKNPAEKN